LADLVQPLLAVRRVLREQIGILHRRLLAVVRNDEVCSRLITIPGVGLVVALTHRATVDVPARFRKSKSVGAVFGLTCALTIPPHWELTHLRCQIFGGSPY
jgi:transposase